MTNTVENSQKTKRKRIIIDVTDQQHKDIKIHAAKMGLSIKQFIIMRLAMYEEK